MRIFNAERRVRISFSAKATEVEKMREGMLHEAAADLGEQIVRGCEATRTWTSLDEIERTLTLSTMAMCPDEFNAHLAAAESRAYSQGFTAGLGEGARRAFDDLTTHLRTVVLPGKKS